MHHMFTLSVSVSYPPAPVVAPIPVAAPPPQSPWQARMSRWAPWWSRQPAVQQPSAVYGYPAAYPQQQGIPMTAGMRPNYAESVVSVFYTNSILMA